MTYEVFARKYRPRVFSDLVGQEAVAQALRYAVSTGRTASVYLFAGSHGVGKTSVARIFAKALNCPNAKEGAPCGTCETCESIARNECLDVVEIDAASNSKVEDVRTLRESVGYKPASCKFKVYILDEVHRLSTNAFDALLKTFEESPPLVRFVLATTELHKVPTTILSRAQVFRFQRAGLEDLVRRLARICQAEGLQVEDDALRTIARRARGSIRDSQKLLDQVVALALGGTDPSSTPVELGTEAAPAPAGAGPGEAPPARAGSAAGASVAAGPGDVAGRAGVKRTIRAADVAFLLGDASQDVVVRCLGAIAQGQPGALLTELHGFAGLGGRPDALATDLLEALRGSLYLKTAGESSPLLEDVTLLKEDLRPTAEALSEEGLLYALQILQEAQMKMREAREPRLVLELALVRLARARELRPIGEVLARLERLERSSGGAQAPGGEAARPPAAVRTFGAAAAAAVERGAATAAAVERGAVERGAVERSAADRSAADRSAAERSAADRSAGAKPGVRPGDAPRANGDPALRPEATRLDPAREGAPALRSGSASHGETAGPGAERPDPRAPRPRSSYDYPPEFTRPPVTVGVEPVPGGALLAGRAAAFEGAEGAATAVATVAPPSAPAASTLALEAIVTAWERVRASAAAQTFMLGRALASARPASLSGDRLTIEVKASDLLWSNLTDPVSATRVAEALRQSVGRAFDVRFQRVRDEAAGAAAARGPGRSASVYDEPIVQIAQRVLGSLQVGGGW